MFDYALRLQTMDQHGVDVGIVSLRTTELVFDEGFFSRLAWEAEGRTHDRPLDAFSAAGKSLRVSPAVFERR